MKNRAELPKDWTAQECGSGPVLSAAQMRAAEAAAIASGHTTGLAMMEAAGAGVVAAIAARWQPAQALILCGPGNNGGDGFVIARLLAGLGWQVSARLLGDPARLPPDAATNAQRWAETAPIQRIISLTDPALHAEITSLGPDDLLVDALFGTGLTRPVEGLDALPSTAAHRVAVDLPSGLETDSGRVLAHALAADLTVTFHAPKYGHFLGDAPALCGALEVVHIGLTVETEGLTTLIGPPPARVILKSGGHKYRYGHLLVAAGGGGKGGAARLAARAALRVGAGLVTLAPTPGAMQENAARLDAVMLTPLDGPERLAEILTDPRLNALLLGPGLGVERAGALTLTALAARRATVLDADALTAFAAAPQALFDALHPDCVLTPHDGEFTRLFPDLAPLPRIAATEAAANRAGCTVLLKGPDTIIASPGAPARLHVAAYQMAAPWLATAGAGDVLAGLIAGLLARGLPPPEAAAAGAWLHAAAARAFGPGLIAEDLPETIPQVLRRLT